MPYPYVVIDNNPYAEQPDTPRIQGPYKYNSDLYLFAFFWPETGDQGHIRAFKSIDAGVTWLEVDEEHRPAAYDGTGGGEPSTNISTMQDGSSVVVAFLTNGGAIIEDGLAPGLDWPQNRLAFAPFDMATDLWGSTTTGGPTVYHPESVWPRRQPETIGGNDLYYEGDFFRNNGWGLIAMCKRSNGDYVFLCDLDSEAFEITQHIPPPDITMGNTYRRCSLIAWNGLWQDPIQLFISSPFAERRDHFPGNVVAGDDGGIHAFAISVGYVEDFGTQSDGDPYQLPPGDQNSAHALHQTINISGILSSVQIISTELNYGFFDHVLREAVRAGNTLFVPYHKENGYLAVATYPINAPAWTETEVAEVYDIDLLGAGSYPPLESAITVAGSTPYLLWLQQIGGPWNLMLSRYVSGAWTGTVVPDAPESVYSTSSEIRFGNSMAGRAVTGAIGLHWWRSSGPERYFEYWQMSIAAAGGARGRYYGV